MNSITQTVASEVVTISAFFALAVFILLLVAMRRNRNFMSCIAALLVCLPIFAFGLFMAYIIVNLGV